MSTLERVQRGEHARAGDGAQRARKSGRHGRHRTARRVEISAERGGPERDKATAPCECPSSSVREGRHGSVSQEGISQARASVETLLGDSMQTTMRCAARG